MPFLLEGGDKSGIILCMDETEVSGLREGRRLELKREMPTHADLARTAAAFANDAGGELIIGIDDSHRVVGVPDDKLQFVEEQVSSVIFDRCCPAILPEVSYRNIEGKNIVHVQIYRGSSPPYYVKKEGKESGTYVRVGSHSRRATPEMIRELELRGRNISFDSAIVFDKSCNELDISSFREMYEEKVQEPLNEQTLRKLELIRCEQNVYYPTHAMVLLSDDELRNSLFPCAKIECARFKGTSAGEFLDQKTVEGSICTQAEVAYDFILRHINKVAQVRGVYTVPRWEYPIEAIREVLRNAVVHRQYSLSSMDIKVAVYDDMVEITSPGLLPPGIDYAAMRSRQSDARNRVIALVFKKLGIIDQWGNGLRLIAEAMAAYPEIELRWHEAGLSFQVQFVKKDAVFDALVQNLPPVYAKMLLLIKENDRIAVNAMAEAIGVSKRQCERYIAELLERGVLRSEGKTRSRRWVISYDLPPS